MKVKNVHIQNFKRFTDLKIEGIPETAKMVVLVGQNGCGKTSVFEAFNSLLFGSWQSVDNQDMDLKQWDLLDASKRRWNVLDGKNYFRKDSKSKENIDPLFYDKDLSKDSLNDKSMYFRTAYRNQAELNVTSLSQEAIVKRQPILLHANDERVSANYTKLLYETMAGIYSEENNEKSVKVLRNELIGKLQQSMESLFGDLILNNIQSPLKDGSFYFKKGTVENYHYKNLSSGEKAVFDLLLDLIVNLDDYQDTLFFIDEPEAHIHTKLQGQVIEEIYNLIPDNSQLWITTHSLGVMTKAKELSIQHPGSVVFLDFDGHDFDQPVTITPSQINRIVWQKFMSIALDGLEEKLAPEIIVLCEGSLEGKKRFNFDADIYTNIFQENYPNITFISGGSSNDLLQETKEFKMLSSVLDQKSKVIRLVDRDDHSDKEVIELEQQEIFTTSRRHIESYLFDDELIIKLVVQENKQDLKDQAIAIKKTALQNSINRGNASDDIKSAAGEIFTELKKLLNLTRCGNKTEAFMKNTMLPLITPETEVYKEMERGIIQPILQASKKSKN